MNALNQDAGEFLSRALAWWTSELSSVIPAAVRAWWHDDPADLTIVIDDNGRLRLDETQTAGIGDSESDRDGTLDDRTWSRIAELSQGRRPATVHLQITESMCLARDVEVPSAAASKAGRILALDLERTMPFDLNQIFAAHCRDGHKTSNGAVRFRQFIVKRDKITGVRDRIEAQGLRVTQIDVLASKNAKPLGVNFLDRDSAFSRHTNRPLWVLSIIAVALALTAVWINVVRYETAVADLAQQIEIARTGADAAKHSSVLANSDVQDSSALSTLKSGENFTVAVLEEVSRILPDTAWLTDFSVSNGAVDISGFAGQAAPLVPRLEQSPLFSDVALTAPVTLDSSRNQERFSFRLTLKTTAKRPVQNEQSLPTTEEPPL